MKYLWEIPMFSNDTQMISTMNNSAIVNETLLQLDYCDRLTMSIRTADGNCYEDTDQTYTFYSVKINLVCPGITLFFFPMISLILFFVIWKNLLTFIIYQYALDFDRNNCSIHAIIIATSIVNIYNISEQIPSEVVVDSISCLGCGAIMNDNHKCYKDKGLIFLNLKACSLIISNPRQKPPEYFFTGISYVQTAFKMSTPWCARKIPLLTNAKTLPKPHPIWGRALLKKGSRNYLNCINGLMGTF